MVKGITAVIAVVVVLVIFGSLGAAYYLGYFGGEDTKTKGPPPVAENRPPVAFFEMLNGTNARVGDVLYFDCNGSSDPENELSRFEWYWGDGSKTIVNNVTQTKVNHSYWVAGEFDINLTVVDARGGRDTIIKEMTIRPTDYTDSGNTILLSREPAGVSLPSNFSTTIPIEEYVVSMEINITFIGIGLGDSQLVDSILDVTVTNPLYTIIANESKQSRLSQQSIKFFFDSKDLVAKGDYKLDTICEQGSLQMSYSIEVLY